jgi:putative transcriptional regulator
MPPQPSPPRRMGLEVMLQPNTGTADVRPRHHLTEELLVDYASGALAEASATLVASHLVLCPACRRELAAVEALGGVLLGEAPPAALSAPALAAVMRKLDEPAATEPPAGADIPDLPRPLARHVGQPIETLAWRRMLPGLQYFPLPLKGEGRAYLLRIKPGRAMPRHSHGGDEMTLVLRGSYTDRLGEFRPGDVAIVDAAVDHKPVAGRGGDCICLAVTEAPLVLTGAVGRLFRPFVRF